jgi:hypothetical protein
MYQLERPRQATVVGDLFDIMSAGLCCETRKNAVEMIASTLAVVMASWIHHRLSTRTSCFFLGSFMLVAGSSMAFWHYDLCRRFVSPNLHGVDWWCDVIALMLKGTFQGGFFYWPLFAIALVSCGSILLLCFFALTIIALLSRFARGWRDSHQRLVSSRSRNQ